MSAPLPRLRGDLDFMPSPVEQSPGLLIRDSFRYSDAVLIVPPPLVQCLSCFDGQQTQLDLRALLVEISGQFEVGDLEDQLIQILTRSGFLEDETFQAMKAAREREFLFDQEHRQPFFLVESQDDVANFVDDVWLDSFGGLIENQQLRLEDQG